MIKLDEDALVCDLAETYHIYDYKQLPANMVAVFSCGLRENSRIKMKLSDQIVSFETLLLAGVYDRLNFLLWTKTKDAEKGRNIPKAIADELNQTAKQAKQTNTSTFDSSEEFERKRNELIRMAKGGGG